MTRAVEAVTPETLVTDVARRMMRRNIDALPVCSSGYLVGMVTERNLFMRATAQGGDLRGKQVRDVMDPKVVSCFEDQELSDALERLRGTQQRQLYVIDRDGRLVGLVRRQNLTQHRADVRGRTQPKPRRASTGPRTVRGG